jgi:hypothetical protein
MGFNTIFNNISIISWQSVLLLEEGDIMCYVNSYKQSPH